MSFADRMRGTLGSPEWLQKHEAGIKRLLPDVWTLATNLDGLRIGFGLKVLGIEWMSEAEFGRVMVWLEKIGILQRQNGYTVRANPDSIFGQAKAPAHR